jgi:hypothetical protein
MCQCKQRRKEKPPSACHEDLKGTEGKTALFLSSALSKVEPAGPGHGRFTPTVTSLKYSLYKKRLGPQTLYGPIGGKTK